MLQEVGEDKLIGSDEELDEEDVKRLAATRRKRTRAPGSITIGRPKPLVVVGPLCAGKTVLIDYLKYNKG